MRSERSRHGEQRKAVLFLPPAPAAAGGAGGGSYGSYHEPEEALREALTAAARADLLPVAPPARSAEEADALLARHPDAVLLIHPGGRIPRDARPRPGRALWQLLRCGAGLRLCETATVAEASLPEGSLRPARASRVEGASSAAGASSSEESSPPPGAPLPGGSPAPGPMGPDDEDRLALLVVELPREGAPAAAGRAVPAERAPLCRDFAARIGLPAGPVLGESAEDWAVELRRAVRRNLTLTAVVHPGIAPPAPDGPDALLWGWLRAGREIRSVFAPLDGRFSLRRSGAASDRELGSTHLGRLSAPPPDADEDEDDWLFPASLDREIRAPRRRAAQPPPGSRGPAGPPPSGDEDHTCAHRPGPFEVPESAAADYLGTAAQRRTISHDAQPAGRRPPLFRRTGRPLPHDGLFIRRNSAFGTRSPLGVRDLIEQGVIIGQEQIRFDDFVAARTEQVPGPPPGRAVGVSHGLAAAQGEFRADEATTHFLEITLKAGEAPPEDALAEPLPVNFVFVVDTSGSMHGEKLDCVKAALQTLYDRLRPTDCLGVITFEHHVRTVLPATAKRELPRERFAQVVAGLRAGGGTDINLGVQYGIDEIGRNALGGRTVNCLYLFSDGGPTSGERDWVRIRTNIAAKLRGDLTVSCFGFGSDARMPELAALAGLAGGHATFVTRPEQVGTDLLADLKRRDHLAAIDIQLRLDIAPDVEIRHLYGHDLVTDPRARAAVLREAAQAAERARRDHGAEALPDLIAEETGIRIFAPDLAFGETYWIVLELTVPPGREPHSLGTGAVQYVDTVTREGHRHELGLAADLTLTEETVAVHAMGLWTSEVTFHALDDLYDRDRDAATKRLKQHIQVLRAAHSRLPAREFRDDQVTLQKLITLTGSLDTVVSFSDQPHGPGGMAPAVMMMSDFGRVRSGFWPHH
ncbi:VWA domain-containing protein [Streptomyces sp. NPDC020792]|uniref:VWA domain-containing protein n=1 Tax=Streptomyces sp. NPDC020792 TaxID=3365089 RepID=UPI00379B4ED9